MSVILYTSMVQKRTFIDSTLLKFFLFFTCITVFRHKQEQLAAIMTSVLHFHTQIEHMTWKKEIAFILYLTYSCQSLRRSCVTQHCLTINKPCINLCGQWIFFSFSAQVHTKFHCRQAHIPGSDTSCLSFSYDGMTLASRGGKKNI